MLGPGEDYNSLILFSGISPFLFDFAKETSFFDKEPLRLRALNILGRLFGSKRGPFVNEII